jgi:predicted AAA+ superfamily ATPase
VNEKKFDQVLERAESLLGRLEAILPAPLAEPDWKSAIAFRWRKRNGRGHLQPVPHPHVIRFDDLQDIDE